MAFEAGPAAVRWLRSASGLTQADLAERSGVSVRTIRALERGQVSTPHVASLEALADGAGLTPPQRAAFLGAWSPDRARSFTELAARGADIEQLLAEHHIHSTIEQRLLLNSARIEVGSDRLPHSHEASTVIQALYDGLDRTIQLMWGDQSSDVRMHALTASSGCELLSRIELPEHGLVAFELRLAERLRRGEVYPVSYRIAQDHLADRPDLAAAHAALQDSDGCTIGARRTVGLCMVEVQFTEERPTHIWEISRPPGEQFQRQKEVQPDSRGVVRFARPQAPPADYGFEWQWD